MSLKLAGTGHRPQSLGGFNREVSNRLIVLATDKLSSIKPSLVITGGALGWDTALAQAAIALNIPLELHIPCKDYSSRWPLSSQQIYHQILSSATKVKYLSDRYHISLLHKRNISMVDSCNILLALYNGIPKGGTHNCVQYALSTSKEIINVWNDFQHLSNIESRQSRLCD